MRKTTLVMGVLLGGALFSSSAVADPYRWCAEYGTSSSNGTNCYFVTRQQCQAAISGNGGFCRHNTFYTGTDRGPDRRRGERYGMRQGW
jgi:hypothetical protein